MQVFKIYIQGLGGYITRDLAMVTEELRVLQEEGSPGDKATIEILEMTQEQLDALPEFPGF